jgi:hypothetical protein
MRIRRLFGIVSLTCAGAMAHLVYNQSQGVRFPNWVLILVGVAGLGYLSLSLLVYAFWDH